MLTHGKAPSRCWIWTLSRNGHIKRQNLWELGRPSIEQYPGSLSVDRAAVVSDGLLDELDDLAGSVHLVCEFIAESRPDLVGGGEPVGEVLVELGR